QRRVDTENGQPTGQSSGLAPRFARRPGQDEHKRHSSSYAASRGRVRGRQSQQPRGFAFAEAGRVVQIEEAGATRLRNQQQLPRVDPPNPPRIRENRIFPRGPRAPFRSRRGGGLSGSLVRVSMRHAASRGGGGLEKKGEKGEAGSRIHCARNPCSPFV
ncbi:MAG: hypothetical protein BJ554DRAFT_7094, partial [Olpidium bornovanus]